MSLLRLISYLQLASYFR